MKDKHKKSYQHWSLTLETGTLHQEENGNAHLKIIEMYSKIYFSDLKSSKKPLITSIYSNTQGHVWNKCFPRIIINLSSQSYLGRCKVKC